MSSFGEGLEAGLRRFLFGWLALHMRYYYQEITRLWQVVGILVTGKRRIQDRVTEAYEHMVISLGTDRLPEEMRARFDTLREKFIVDVRRICNRGRMSALQPPEICTTARRSISPSAYLNSAETP
jgi:hypothetical protein